MSSTPTQQRFDDRLATILAIDTGNQNGANSLWTQLVDLLAQGRGAPSGPHVERALAALALLRDRVDINLRQQGAAAIARRCGSAPLVVLLSGDASPVVCALFDRLQLSEPDWLAVMPMIGPLARSRLRARLADLPPAAVRSLEALAAGDLALPPQSTAMASAEVIGDVQSVSAPRSSPSTPLDTPSPVTDSAEAVDEQETAETPSSIAELVRRIDDWQKRRPANDASAVAASSAQVRLSVDTDGTIRAVDGMPSAALCGLSLAEPARPGETGVDAGVARAFARRAPIDAGRVFVAAGLPWSGLWILSAVPLFDPDSGRFLGYRGAVIPSDAGGRDTPDPAPATEAQPLAEAMRQMVHELRSPLNAISGFSQLIEGQYFGPVGSNYRMMAQSIRRDAASLLQVFEDLDLAARMDLGATSGAAESVDLVAAVRDAASAADKGQAIIETSSPTVRVAAASEPLRSLLSRLVALTAGTASSGGPLASLRTDPSQRLAVLELPGWADTGDSADHGSPMGHDFSLRLIEQLAIRAGATVDFVGDKAILNFPIAMHSSERVGSGVS